MRLDLLAAVRERLVKGAFQKEDLLAAEITDLNACPNWALVAVVQVRPSFSTTHRPVLVDLQRLFAPVVATPLLSEWPSDGCPKCGNEAMPEDCTHLCELGPAVSCVGCGQRFMVRSSEKVPPGRRPRDAYAQAALHGYLSASKAQGEAAFSLRSEDGAIHRFRVSQAEGRALLQALQEDYGTAAAAQSPMSSGSCSDAGSVVPGQSV